MVDGTPTSPPAAQPGDAPAQPSPSDETDAPYPTRRSLRAAERRRAEEQSRAGAPAVDAAPAAAPTAPETLSEPVVAAEPAEPVATETVSDAEVTSPPAEPTATEIPSGAEPTPPPADSPAPMEDAVHPDILARAKRRSRSRASAILWILVVALFVGTAVIGTSGVWAQWLVQALAAPGQGIVALLHQAGLAEVAILLGRGGPMPSLLAVAVLLLLAVLLAIVAAVLSSISMVRRILAPIFTIGGALVAWSGLTSISSGLVRFQPIDIAWAAMLLGLALTLAVFAVWVGLGGRAAGLGAVVIVGFLTVLAPLVAMGWITMAGGGSSGLAAGSEILAWHGVQSTLVVVGAVVAVILLLRSATYRRG